MQHATTKEIESDLLNGIDTAQVKIAGDWVTVIDVDKSTIITKIGRLTLNSSDVIEYRVID